MRDTKIITENIVNSMNSIFSFSLARTNNATEAEDLSQQIITELLSSADSLKDINAFYGWMWSVAKNTYGKYSRKRQKERNMQGGYDIDSVDGGNMTAGGRKNVEEDMILKEDINLLKRELSLLTQKYREAVVKYYIEDKSCAQIAGELSVTVETVKHLLFKARKILKEGMNMNREFGEKSYKPGFFWLDKWIKSGWLAYRKATEALDTRKLPGNILLSAYYAPLTMDEISMELGVAAPYLEDEVKILLECDLLKQLQNGRYQTNIFIYTTVCQEDIILKTKDIYKKHAQKLISLVDKKISEVKELVFLNEDVSQNKLKWFVSHFILWHAARKNQKDLKFPVLPTGAIGFLQGYNHGYLEYDFGFWGKARGERYSGHYGGWVHVTNYKLMENRQVRIGGSQQDIDFLISVENKQFDKFMPDEIAHYLQWPFIEKDGDSYKSLCPVMSQAQYDKLCEICSDAVDEMNTALIETSLIVAEVMKNHAPSAVQDQCKDLAVIKSSFNNMASIIANLCENGYLNIPSQHEILTIYTVI